tara:strand:+ start:440 stop:634 length:195 start_codon:yes stop_codon:yes gene_type:complete
MEKLSKEEIVGELLVNNEITGEEAITLLEDTCSCSYENTTDNLVWSSNDTLNPNIKNNNHGNTL